MISAHFANCFERRWLDMDMYDFTPDFTSDTEHMSSQLFQISKPSTKRVLRF